MAQRREQRTDRRQVHKEGGQREQVCAKPSSMDGSSCVCPQKSGGHTLDPRLSPPVSLAVHQRGSYLPAVLLAALLGLLAWSGWTPRDRPTWWLEISPILIALPILIATRRRFPLTPLAYWLIFIHALILMLGGH